MNQPAYVDKRAYYRCDIGSNDEIWEPNEIAIEVWSRLGKARRAIGSSIGNRGETNKWIKWTKPGPLNPECGFRVYTPGRIKKKEFSQFVVTVLGKHFRLSCWCSKHAGQTLLDTEDLGLEEDFFANLDMIVERVTKIVVQVDEWTRAGRLKESFPEQWIGLTRWQAVMRLFQQATMRD